MPKVLVPLADGCEEIEAVTIIDLLRRAEIEVISASLKADPNRTVKASRGVVLIADTNLEKVINDDFDMIVLPGGLEGTDHLSKDPFIQQLLKKIHYKAAICAAPLVLAKAGYLINKTVTSYPNILQHIAVEQEITLSDKTVVMDDNIITSRGVGTAIEFSLTLIKQLTDKNTMMRVKAELVQD